MLRHSSILCFRMKLGSMYVDYKVLSRDHRRSVRVEEALVDPMLPMTVMPLTWLEALRSPSPGLPTGFHVEKPVYSVPRYGDRVECLATSTATISTEKEGTAAAMNGGEPNAVQAGPLVLYVTGQNVPIILNPLFVAEHPWGLLPSPMGEVDLRLGMDAIEQCTLYAELRPGGLLYPKLPHPDLKVALEPVHTTLRRYGMKCGLSESPMVPRPWTRMKHMFIDELQRGPRMTEFVGHNPRNGSAWRFSQHTKYFRQGVWRETIRRHEMNDGLHAHSSWQKSPQQAVPDVSFMAPYP